MNNQTVLNALPSSYGISCSSPTVTVASATTSGGVQVTIQTTAGTSNTASIAGPSGPTLVWALTFPFSGLAFLSFGTIWPGRKDRRWFKSSGALLSATLFLSGCGGSFTPPTPITTPNAQYFITITEVLANASGATSIPPTNFVQTSLIVPLVVGAQTVVTAPASAHAAASTPSLNGSRRPRHSDPALAQGQTGAGQ